jgi:hypothetical protein
MRDKADLLYRICDLQEAIERKLEGILGVAGCQIVISGFRKVAWNLVELRTASLGWAS